MNNINLQVLVQSSSYFSREQFIPFPPETSLDSLCHFGICEFTSALAYTPNIPWNFSMSSKKLFSIGASGAVNEVFYYNNALLASTYFLPSALHP